jgi:hypothetical protein
MALSKQYCLRDPPVGGDRVVLRGQDEKQEAPKLSAALNFLWLLSLFQDKDSNIIETCNNFQIVKSFKRKYL